MNVAMDQTLSLLQPVKDQFGSTLTWADLIVFAGNVAIEETSTLKLVSDYGALRFGIER